MKIWDFFQAWKLIKALYEGIVQMVFHASTEAQEFLQHDKEHNHQVLFMQLQRTQTEYINIKK